MKKVLLLLYSCSKVAGSIPAYFTTLSVGTFQQKTD